MHQGAGDLWPLLDSFGRLNQEALLTSSGQRLEMLQNILECTEQLPRQCLAPDINSPEAEINQTSFKIDL